MARIPLLCVFGLSAALTQALLVAVYLFPYDTRTLEAGGPLVITARDGQVLRRVVAENGRPGRDTWVALEDIPAAAVSAVIESEDERFFDHGGVDGVAIARAAALDVGAGQLAYGGSTITMQLARMLHSADRPRTLRNKLREAVLAMRMERAVDKRTILEHYLNRAYYGNGAWGIDAAARLYFDKPAAALSLGEAVFLAVLPRAPTAYDPTRHRDAALRRRDYVLELLVHRGQISADEAARARAQVLAVGLHRPPMRAAHFTDWVLSTLPDAVRERGGAVTTTLDLDLQTALEHRVAEHVAGLSDRNLDQAGAVVLDTETGAVLAMVGSADFDDRDGQINIATWRRHPGSALKPFVYALAIEGGAHPASIAYDVREVGQDPSAGGYHVVNSTQPERGPVRLREALAGSYNLAAVDVLSRVGVPALMSALRRAGVGELAMAPDDYGLRLALGATKVRLIDLASGYGFLARGGAVRAAHGVVQVRADGPDGALWRPAPARDRRVVSPQTAWLVMDMLADPEARRPAFGHELPLDLPFAVAAKTGTSRGFADTVAVAVTREVTVAAWAGNFDGVPTQGLVAMRSAAPIARDALLWVSQSLGRPLTLPERPAGVEVGYVCPLSGLRPSAACPHRKLDYHRAGHGPAHTCDWHRSAADTSAGMHAGTHAGTGAIAGARASIRYPARAHGWARRQLTRGGRHLSSLTQ